MCSQATDHLQRGCPCWGMAVGTGEDTGPASDTVGAHLKLCVHGFADIHGQRTLPFLF